jgi:predicted nucleotidyltransferase
MAIEILKKSEEKNIHRVLPEADQRPLDDLRDRLLTHLSGLVHRIVLYGSRARGDAGEDADMDVMVVLAECPSSAIEQARATRYEVMQRHCFRPLISLLLLSEREWDDMSRRSAGLKRNIEREGITVWPTK